MSLFNIKGLHRVIHSGPSSIAVDALEQTATLVGHSGDQQHDVEVFLEGAGVLKEYIEFFRSRVGKAIEYYSAFISYNTKDQEFADRLYTDLRQKGIRCWLATEDLKIGDRFRRRIDE